MFGRFMPQENNFFELFNNHASQIETGLLALQDLIVNFADETGRDARLRRIIAAEKAADKITHETIDSLHKTFITPLDRDAIHKLISTMDDILDLAEDVAQTIDQYDIQTLTPQAVQLADVCVECGQRVKKLVGLLSNMKHASEMLALAQEIDKLESDADHIMRAAMAKLFRDENDVKNLIKMKAIYEILETITDKAEDVANVVEGIVLENA